MTLNLNSCDKACLGCIKGYKKKFNPEIGSPFTISCKGIPKTYLANNISETMTIEDRKTALAMLDPVTWAAETLDWHCLDPDGSIWARKNPIEYKNWIDNNPGKSIEGKSRYHRPYQATLLRCTAKRKVFRIGRQAGKSEAIIVAMLYHLFTKPGVPENEGFKIIVITPYQSQIELIFGRCLELLRNGLVTANSVKRNVKAPNYTIELFNGSQLKGFTAGTKSGNNAGAVRGQHANMLIFDEADYLSAGDIDSALSIITNFPDASVWMSSTPTGKRERFYETCQSKLWKEFHYPSSVNPMWSDELEQTFREGLSSLSYKHEVEAEFGEQEEGVFQNVYIQAAKERYEYNQMSYDQRWTYTIGVDWNDVKVGTTIAVLGYNPTNNLFTLVDRHIVSREGWTQLYACQKIADLNAVWKPVAIYVDKGFGGTQFEVLKKYGYDAALDPTKGINHPDARLRDIIKQYDFSSKIEIHDLITKEPILKAAKPFLVENMVRRFETQNFKFPEKDDQFEKELLGYVIDRITQSGSPVYKASNPTTGDHTLDAVMLAQVAFTMEKTQFGVPLYRADLAFSGRFGSGINPIEEIPHSVIVKDERKQDPKDPRQLNRPSMNRSEGLSNTQSILSQDLPANHVNQSIRSWTWEGFNKDEPQQSKSELVQIARSRRPTRKQI